jgi:hypothetical protein
MDVRINPTLNNTEELLGQILQVVLPSEDRVVFLCPAGQADKILARVRVMVTRKRESVTRKGKKPKRFTLRSIVTPLTHEGKRCEQITIWRQVKDLDWMAEQLEDLMSND